MKRFIILTVVTSFCFLQINMHAQYTGGSADGYSSTGVQATLGTGSIPAPTVADDSICSGTTATLTATAPGGTYNWFTVPTGGIPVFTGTTFTTPVLSSTTTYYVETTMAGCTSPRTPVTVTVIPMPSVFISANSTICSGQSVNITVSGGTQYSWTSNPVGYVSTQPAITVSPTVTTTYYVVVSNSMCSSNDSVLVTVNQVPVITLSNDTSVCSSQNIQLAASGGTQYSWTSNPVGFTSTQSQVNVSPTVTTTYYVTVSNGTCSSNDSVVVTINSPFVISISGPASTCSGQTITLVATGGTQYNWTSNPTGFTSTSDSVQVSPTTNTVYYVTSSQGQCSVTDSFSVNISPLPNININSPSAICNGDTATLAASGGQNYLWNTGANTSTLIVNPSVTTSYWVTATSAANCSAVDSVTILVVAPPIALISGATATCKGIASTLVASGGSFYQWNTGAATASITVSPPVTSTYFVTVSNGACSDTASVQIEILDDESTLYIPNVFTPNGDGTNEIFKVGANGITNFQGMIYNRWGELLFTWNDVSGGWDGVYKGNPVSEGVYVYVISCSTMCNEGITKRGAVTVLR